MKPALSSYVAAVRDICSGGYSMPAKVTRIQAEATKLVDKLELTDNERFIPEGGYGRNLLYRDPDYGFVVIAMVWPPKAGGAPHDHATWGVVAVSEGTVRIENYQREDDGSNTQIATLKRTLQLDAVHGQTGHVLPPHEDIHAISNPSESELAISIHTYGRDIRRCRMFHASTGAIEYCDLDYHTDGNCDVEAADHATSSAQAAPSTVP